ncbi:acylneuraminate cytidylyltransferase family protein [Lachnotalea sp. AF33-28]|uniref:acylneuraminate cytidylyltransferase family protein n=1 Tax=Lachnotalea sp. AF33-28 TaxID=2292046 RepID=UPI000E4F301F|nr:hypothetical protein [Lachnotalea sp. AF33-28]RHP34965.1 hypothetical protein DWZ56_05495 [Lachnotalea sp. AF33-28]
MKVVAMIPIKLNNERVPGKNIKKFSDGTPLMSLIQKACIHAKLIDEIYVYCSNSEVQDYILDGVQYLERPDYLDTSEVNCNDIIREFMKMVDADIYVVSHATGPFTRSESIDACIRAVISNEYDSAFLAKRIQEFLWQNGSAMNFDIQHFPRTQDLIPIYSEAPGAYVFLKETFLKYDRRVGVKPYIHEVSEIESRDIDFPDDFEIADAIYSHMKKMIAINHKIK